MNKEKYECSICEDYVYDEITDYYVNSHDELVCDECGLRTHCFCDGCGEYVPTSECIVTDLCSSGIEITEVLCGQCQDEEE